MEKPLDCIGTSGPLGKYDFRPTVTYEIDRLRHEVETLRNQNKILRIALNITENML